MLQSREQYETKNFFLNVVYYFSRGLLLAKNSVRRKGHLDKIFAGQKNYPTFRGQDKLENCQDCSVCIDVCPTSALSRGDHLGLVLKVEFCTSCEYCVVYCPASLLKMSMGHSYILQDSSLQLVIKDR